MYISRVPTRHGVRQVTSQQPPMILLIILLIILLTSAHLSPHFTSPHRNVTTPADTPHWRAWSLGNAPLFVLHNTQETVQYLCPEYIHSYTTHMHSTYADILPSHSSPRATALSPLTNTPTTGILSYFPTGTTPPYLAKYVDLPGYHRHLHPPINVSG